MRCDIARGQLGLVCGCSSHNGFLTRRGYELARGQGVDKAEASRYLDKVGSVSALVEVEEFHVFDEQLIDQQYRRFLSAS